MYFAIFSFSKYMITPNPTHNLDLSNRRGGRVCCLDFPAIRPFTNCIPSNLKQRRTGKLLPLNTDWPMNFYSIIYVKHFIITLNPCKYPHGLKFIHPFFLPFMWRTFVILRLFIREINNLLAKPFTPNFFPIS